MHIYDAKEEALPLFGRLRLNTFPRSERAKSNPRSIRIFRQQNRRKNRTKPQETDSKKCRCFEGPNKVFHFSGKVLDCDFHQPHTMKEQTSYLRNFRKCESSHVLPQGNVMFITFTEVLSSFRHTFITFKRRGAICASVTIFPISPPDPNGRVVTEPGSPGRAGACSK